MASVLLFIYLFPNKHKNETVNFCNYCVLNLCSDICVCNLSWLEILWFQGWDVDHAMYSTPWYAYSQKYRKHLNLVIMRAQRPVEITVGHYYSLSLQSCELVSRQQFKRVYSPSSVTNSRNESTKIWEASDSVSSCRRAPCNSQMPLSLQVLCPPRGTAPHFGDGS